MGIADTKTRILDAAERLFSEDGLGSASMRAITTAAEVNLAAVNYHFGSKEGLIQAVVARRFEPVNRERLRRLDALEADGDIGLDEVLDALLRPAFELAADPSAGSFCTRLIGRLQSEADPALRRIFRHQFREVGERFLAAIMKTCPHLEHSDLMWRFQFMIGALGFTMTDLLGLYEKSGGLCDPRDVDGATRQLIRFAAAGLQAPLVTVAERTEGGNLA